MPPCSEELDLFTTVSMYRMLPPMAVHARPITTPGGVTSYILSAVNTGLPTYSLRFSDVISAVCLPSFSTSLRAALRKIYHVCVCVCVCVVCMCVVCVCVGVYCVKVHSYTRKHGRDEPYTSLEAYITNPTALTKPCVLQLEKNIFKK